MVLNIINEVDLTSVAAKLRFPAQEINPKIVFNSGERKIVNQKTFIKIERKIQTNPIPKIKGINKSAKKLTKGAIKEIIPKLEITIGNVKICAAKVTVNMSVKI